MADNSRENAVPEGSHKQPKSFSSNNDRGKSNSRPHRVGSQNRSRGGRDQGRGGGRGREGQSDRGGRRGNDREGHGKRVEKGRGEWR